MALHKVMLCVTALGIIADVNSQSPPDRWPVRDYSSASCERSTLALEKPLLDLFPGVPQDSVDFSLSSDEDSLWAVGGDSLVKFRYSTGRLIGIFELPTSAGALSVKCYTSPRALRCPAASRTSRRALRLANARLSHGEMVTRFTKLRRLVQDTVSLDGSHCFEAFRGVLCCSVPTDSKAISVKSR